MNTNRFPPANTFRNQAKQVTSWGFAFDLRPFALVFCLLWWALWSDPPISAATFTNSASIKVDDPNNALTSTNGVFTVSCWFRMSIPSSINLSQNMVILMDRMDGNESANHSYQIRYNYFSGSVEFVTRGSTGTPYVRPLIQRPYLERWYHVAVTRSGSGGIGIFNAYVDGIALPPFDEPFNSGDTRGSGLAIGGISGNSRLFFGDIIEVAIFNVVHSDIRSSHLFDDQRAATGIRGYYKLGYSADTNDWYRNFATNAPAGTDPAVPLGSGQIAFEETDQAGEQSIFDSQMNHGEQAMTPLSGAFAWRQSALARPVPGIAFDFQFSYSSATPTTPVAGGGDDPYDKRVLGAGWRHTFDTRVIIENNLKDAKLYMWDGGIETWSRTNVLQPFRIRHKEYRGELTNDLATGAVEWTTPERLVYRFNDATSGGAMAGRLREIRDFNGNSVQLNWNENDGYLASVTDTAGGRYVFTYDTNRFRLTNVAFQGWSVNFAYDNADRLTNKWLTGPPGYGNINTSWQFQYANPSNGPLVRIIDPRGNTNIFVQYDQYGRKTNTMDALAQATRTEYNVPANRQMRHTDPDGKQWIETYDRKGHILAQQDPLTNITRYTYDDHGNRTSITEPLGWTTLFGYDDRANVIARTNALGEVTRWIFHSNSIPGLPHFNKAIQEITPQPLDINGSPTWTNSYVIEDRTGNLLRHYDALGDRVTYSYTTNGLVEASTNANGHASRFTYNADGFLIARTDPATNTTSFVVNDVGWKLREINPLGDSTAYTLDVNGNPVRVQDVLGRVFLRTYDANGNLLSTTDGKNQLTSYAYDAANQRTNITDRTGTNKWLTFYTIRGKVDRVTDPLTYSVTNFYDTANRLIRVTDPLGNSVTNQYDANGNLIARIDRLGQRWSKTYDRLNRVLAETDPLGNTRTMTYDIAGRILQTTTPNGYPTLHAYDGRGRLTKWHDAEGFDWLYSYDGVGNILDIEDALHGHYVMTYGNRNERILERNQDGFEWRYEYDELLRLKRQTDPNGTTRTPTYDAAGRVLFVDFSTRRRDSYAYDANNNPQTISRRVSGVTTATQFIYDGLDRPIEQTDAFAQTVQYGYDPLGRVTALTYPGGKMLTNRYDALGRLTRQMDWAGRQMIYAYDQADRLISRTYPNGVVQSNSFDDANRITNLEFRSANLNGIAIALAYAYDKNGNKIGSGEKGTLEWPLPSLTDERADYTAAGRLKTRTIHSVGDEVTSLTNNQSLLTSAPTITYSYDPSGNLTNATGNGQSWSLTYDEDNRTTSTAWDCGLTSKHITNRYDALGRRIAKTVDGVNAGYVLNLVGGMERTLCDLDAAGNVTAWYVHGLDLCYRVDAANNVVCYHADAMANIISLTGTNGTNLAQYAYTPYGRSLGSQLSTNNSQLFANPQPYLFVGSQGVMEELPGLYFMRARYYSAEAGVFLSTDPVKKIGPGWKPMAYSYVAGKPLSQVDPEGETPAHLAAFLLGLKVGLLEGVIESVLEDALSPLPTVAGLDEQAAESVTEASFEILSAGKTGYKTAKYAQTVAAAGDPSRLVAAYTFGEVVGGKAGGAIFGFSKFLVDSVFQGGQAIGTKLNTVLFQRGPNTPSPSTLSSPTAGTTPMAIGIQSQSSQPQAVSFQLTGGSSGSQSLSSRTAGAGSYAQTLNSVQPTTPAVASSTGSSGTSGISQVVNRVSNAVSNASNSITQTVKNVAATVSQAVTSAVKTGWNYVTSWFK